MAHCPSYKLPAQITPSLESRGRENSSVIMILLHARRLLRAVLSAGSQHFSSFSPTQITYAEGGQGWTLAGSCQQCFVWAFFCL